MISAFKETRGRGFGMRVSDDEFEKYNENRESRGLDKLAEPPGIRQISPGKNKDGYWTYETMAD